MTSRDTQELLRKQIKACADSIKGTSEIARKTREIILSTPLVEETEPVIQLTVLEDDFI